MKQYIFSILLMSVALAVTGQQSSVKSELSKGRDASQQPSSELMIDGKPYNQYKAEQDAMKQRSMAKKPGGSNYISPISATPNESKPVNNSPRQNENNETQKPAAAPAVTEAAVVKQTVLAPEVPSSLRIPEAKEWTGRAVGGDKATAADVAMPKSDPGQPLNGEDLSAVKPAVKPAAEKPAKRSPSEIEKAKQLQEQTAKVKVANEKEAAAASSTAPELKVETATENAAPVAPSSKPPVAPPAGKQE